MEDLSSHELSEIIEELLLTGEQLGQKYQELEKGYHPYFYKIQSTGKVLYYLGCQHTYNPEHPQFNKIRDLWAKFLVEKGEDSVIVVEGNLRQVGIDEIDAISNHGGEGGLITYLAFKEGIPVECPEPNKKDLAEEMLSKGFSKDEIVYDWFTSMALQYHRTNEKRVFSEYSQAYLDWYKEVYGWVDYDFTLDHMIEIHNKNHDHEFDINKCRHCVYLDTSPIDNKVSEAQSNLRDVAIVKGILKSWNEKKSIFIVYGSGHALTQELALKELLK